MGKQIYLIAILSFGSACLYAQAIHAGKTKLCLSTQRNDVPVSLDFTPAAVSIIPRDPGIQKLEIPYLAIARLAYTETSRHRIDGGAKTAMVSPGIGALVMLSKTRLHWLAINWSDKGRHFTTVLLLDKTGRYDVLRALQARTGKQVEMLDEKTNPFDPTKGSVDVDQSLPGAPNKVAAAARAAMLSMGCIVTKDSPPSIECRRPRGSSELTGAGGERITVSLTDHGSSSEIHITTQATAPRSRNWSTPMIDAMKAGLTEVRSSN